MDDFAAKPGAPNAFGLIGDEANAIAPGKRPLSSMTPTIVLKDGAPYLVTGSPGGSTIITVVLQEVLNVLEFGMNLAEATANRASTTNGCRTWCAPSAVCRRIRCGFSKRAASTCRRMPTAASNIPCSATPIR